ncbi:MAG: NUDIX hydrolase [Dehalococcoidales bacterium]|nr:NUDIX hydrolase [Dehalococcoidales bacterium]
MPEERLSSKRIYDGRVVKLRVDTIRKENGEETIREVIEHDPVIAAVALDNDDTILFVKQYRTPTGKELLEIPAGGVNAGEDPEAAVRREMQEETGFRPGRLVRLGGVYSAPGFTDEYLDIYLATDLEPDRLHAEDTDEIVLVRVPLTDVPALVASGKIEDAKTLAALYLLQEYRKSA